MSFTEAIFAFVGLAVVIAVAGTYLTKAADRFADKTGIGEALVGGLLLGGITSLSGITTSVTAAADGYAQLSFSNAVGGIAAQTSFLAVADLTYRKANLEHASASLPNMMQAVLLIIMLSFVLLVMNAPELSLGFIHPGSVFLLLIYVAGSYMTSRAKNNPMWEPRHTRLTVPDIENKKDEEPLHVTILKLALSAAVVGFAGYFMAKTAAVISENSVLSESFVGALFTSVATSLPELVVAIVAVRQGALVMATGNIIGGNSFDVLFLAFADTAFAGGSIYHSVDIAENFLLSLTILLNAILIMGMLHRQKHGWVEAGWESITVIILFLTGYTWIYWS